ncbi:MAG: hypothetical protein V3V41_10710 [Candidatus Heimdallarchaeota archaeon]
MSIGDACYCPCHDSTAVNTEGCQNCWNNHSHFGQGVFTHPPNVTIYPDNNTNALLQKLSEILNELKEIKKRIG